MAMPAVPTYASTHTHTHVHGARARTHTHTRADLKLCNSFIHDATGSIQMIFSFFPLLNDLMFANRTERLGGRGLRSPSMCVCACVRVRKFLFPVESSPPPPRFPFPRVKGASIDRRVELYQHQRARTAAGKTQETEMFCNAFSCSTLKGPILFQI